MNDIPSAGQLVDSFGKASRGEMPVMEAMAFGQIVGNHDRRLGIAFYATWLSAAPQPTAGPIHYNIGILLEIEEEQDRAIKAYRAATHLMPAFEGARYRLLGMLMRINFRGLHDGKPEEVLVLCRSLMRCETFGQRRQPGETMGIGDVVAYYATIMESLGLRSRGEYFYELYFAEGGQSPYFRDRLADLAQARRRLRQGPALDTRLRCVAVETVAGYRFDAPMMDIGTLERCLSNIDVDVISVLRLFVGGEPLHHQRFLPMVGAISAFRRSATRVDVVELWTDGHQVDMVALEEALRTRSLDSIVVRCAGGGTAESYRPPKPSASWDDLLHVFDELANFRAMYNMDFALRAWIRIDSPEDEARWNAVLEPRGVRADYVIGDDPAGPPLLDGKPASLEPGDSLIIGVDGVLAGGGNLLASRYSDIVAHELAPLGMPAE